ncbi:testis-specific zinc finger protein topi-like [Anopheles maculipalpis]|uniref:testis-specific zinc finger protein topi-like n=1 Tax=Anopheles maculipalpis TaxID=1496333 RepID=UPI0021597C9C|nr:testis-specific zinc finger protein topi-like [Anopheles maculipalpis]
MDAGMEKEVDVDDELKATVVSSIRSMGRIKKIEVSQVTQTLGKNTQQWQNVLQQSGPSKSKAKAANRKKFNCQHCKRKFVYLTGLARHEKKFHPEKEKSSNPGNEQTEKEAATGAVSNTPPTTTFEIVVKCKNCGEIFPDAERFEAHTSRLSWEQLFGNQPEEQDEKVSLFLAQLFIVVIHMALQCEFCDAHFSDFASLFYHESHHSPYAGYSCTFCKLNFLTLEAVLDHREQCQEYNSYRAAHLLNVSSQYCCNVCMAMFGTLSQLYEHRYSNHHYFPRRRGLLEVLCPESDELLLNCELCGFCCNQLRTLLQHRAEKHANTDHDNTPVAEKLAAPQKTTKKLDKEETTRQFLCEKCGKTYTQSSHLWQHLRFHNKVRPFSCSVQGCNRSFTIRPDLSDHIRKCHTGERPYACEVCHKRFLTGSVFYQHRLIHRNERRHACSKCDRRFYRADALKNHMRIHTGEKPYACTHCNRKFRQRGDREKHVRVKHMKFC